MSEAAAPEYEQSEVYSRSLAAFLREDFDPISSLCQHVWATLGGRVDRDDIISLLNALRVPHAEVNKAIQREFGANRNRRLDYHALLTFLHALSESKEPALHSATKRITTLYSTEDSYAPPPSPSLAWVMALCALAPLTWPVFALDPRRTAAFGLFGSTAVERAVIVLIEMVFLFGYAPIALLWLYPDKLAADRVSSIECYAPALGLALSATMVAVSAGLGWFHFNPSHLHAWRRLQMQHKFMQRFSRNRILLQRLGVTVYGVKEDYIRGVWAYELIRYLEDSFARPTGLALREERRAAANGAPRAAGFTSSHSTVGALVGAPEAVRRGSAAGDTRAGPGALLRDEPAAASASSRFLSGRLSLGGVEFKAAGEGSADVDPYFDFDVPDALDRVTHSLSIGSLALFSADWFLVRLSSVWVVPLALLALGSPAIPCLVRSGVHHIPWFGTSGASQFVVAVNALYCAPAVLFMMLTLTSFLDMLRFRDRLLRGLTASVRPELASTCGVRVALDLREPTNLVTWSEVITYLRLRCLSEEVEPFNTLLLPVTLLNLGMCAMFMWEWIAFHVGDVPQEYVISALDILAGISVTWLSSFIYISTARACSINIALEEHAEVLEQTQVEMRMAIRQLRLELTSLEQTRSTADARAAVAQELRSLEETDFLITSVVRKTRNVDMYKPFKLLGISVTKTRLRALASVLIAGFLSGVWRQIDDILFTSFGISF